MIGSLADAQSALSYIQRGIEEVQAKLVASKALWPSGDEPRVQCIDMLQNIWEVVNDYKAQADNIQINPGPKNSHHVEPDAESVRDDGSGRDGNSGSVPSVDL